MDRRNIGWKKEQRQLCQKRYWSSRERNRRRGDCLIRYAASWEAARRKRRAQEHRRPQRMGKQQGKQRRKGQAGRRLPMKSRQKKLSPQEREAEEREAIKKENAELTGKLKRMELEQKASAKLAEKKLPGGLSEFLDYTDEARMAASLEKIGAMYQEQLETGIKERLKGTTPKGLGGAASLTDGMISAEIQKRIRGGL